MALVTKLLRRIDSFKLFHQNVKQIQRSIVSTSSVLLNKNDILLSSYCLQNNIKLYSCRLSSTKTAEQVSVESYRNEHNITVKGKDIPSPYTDLDTCEFPDNIKKYLINQGFNKPTIIQSQAWPIALSGQNFVGIAQTGTGKTLAYLLPALMHIKEKKPKTGRGPRVLIFAPTRELARQIHVVAKDFERLLNIRCACIYGGASRGIQGAELQAGVDIVIATPGRLNDFLMSKTTTLSRCTYIVLDEADRMLDMGFEPQIRQALEGIPLERQMMMFSATWPKEVKYLAKDYLGEYVQVNIGSTELSANHNIKQYVHICSQQNKIDTFQKIMHDISESGYGKILIFTNTKRFVDTLSLMLRRNGWRVIGIHGDKSQAQRDDIIKRFKEGRTNILVATEVAARGLDVDGITHVVNYDYPNTSEDYIHRIGRTGRSENKGVSHTILTEENARQAYSLIEVLKEANQEVPKDLEDMAQNSSRTKMNEQQSRYRPKQGWNQNRRWNKFSSNSY